MYSGASIPDSTASDAEAEVAQKSSTTTSARSNVSKVENTSEAMSVAGTVSIPSEQNTSDAFGTANAISKIYNGPKIPSIKECSDFGQGKLLR